MPVSTTAASLAVPDGEVAKLILGRDLRPSTRDRLRVAGEWPPNFYVAGRAYVLRSDIEAFLSRVKEATDRKRASLSERGKRAVAARWNRARPRCTSPSLPSD